MPGSRVIVCENGTGGGAAGLSATPSGRTVGSAWVEVREVTPNRGFAGGNNFVLEEVLRRGPPPPASVLLLNADTVVRPGALRDALTRRSAIYTLGPA